MLAAVSVLFVTFASRNFAGIPISSVVPMIRFAVTSSVPVVPAETCRSTDVSSVDVPVCCARVRRPAAAVVVPITWVVVTVPDTIAPRTACAQAQGSTSFCEEGHGADTDGHFAVPALAASATTLDPESPLAPAERLIATGEPVTVIAPYEGTKAAGGLPTSGS